MLLVIRCFDYLAGSSLSRGADDQDELLQNILDRRGAIVIASICVSATAVAAAIVTVTIWPLGWLLADAGLTAARWAVMFHASGQSAPTRRQCGRYLIGLALIWSGLFGLAMFGLVRTGHWGLIILACVMTVSVSSAITYRNAAMPRTAILAILLTTVPFLIGIGLFVVEHRWVAFVAGIPLLVSSCSLTFQNHGILVRLIAAERKARALANTDALTGLPNRLSFISHQADVAKSQEAGGYAYLCLDLDGFKHVNDRFGHPAGDLLLKAVAGRLRENTRHDDIVFRIGGDEFIVYLPGANQEECSSVAARIINAMASPFALSEALIVNVGCSAGSACLRDGATSASMILKAADEALYRAKAAGKSRHVHAA